MAVAKMAASAGPSPFPPSFVFLPFFFLSAAVASLALVVRGGASSGAGGRPVPGDLSGRPALLGRGRWHRPAGDGSLSGAHFSATRHKTTLFGPVNAMYGVVLVRS